MERGRTHREGEDADDHFNTDLRFGGFVDSVADLDFKPVTVEENEETILQEDATGPGCAASKSAYLRPNTSASP